MGHTTHGYNFEQMRPSSNTTLLVMFDNNENDRLAASVTDEGMPVIVIRDSIDNMRLTMSVDADDEPEIDMSDAAGNTRLNAWVGSDGEPAVGEPAVGLYDQDVNIRLRLSLVGGGPPVLSLVRRKRDQQAGRGIVRKSAGTDHERREE